jgi:hypothetical protein
MKIKLPFIFVINKQEYKDFFNVKHADRFEIKKHLCELILSQPNNILFGKTQQFNSKLSAETFCIFSDLVDLEKSNFKKWYVIILIYILGINGFRRVERNFSLCLGLLKEQEGYRL